MSISIAVSMIKIGGPLGIFLVFLLLLFRGSKSNSKSRLTKGQEKLALIGISALALTTLVAWLSPSPTTKSEQSIQFTTGDKSPAISGVKGDVTITYGKDGDKSDKQEKKK